MIHEQLATASIMGSKIKSFRNLEVWILGKAIVLDIYRMTKSFPKEELYGLVAQMRRAAVLIPSNVAQGFNRRHNKEYRQVLYIALGSCAELETQMEVSCALKYLPREKTQLILEKLDHESRMLQNLIKKL